MIDVRERRWRPVLASLVAAAVWVLLLVYTALVVHDFYRNANHWVYLSVDDGLANESFTLASQGRYGFLSSPVLFGIERHHGEFSYGPWYFYVAAGLIWLFGYSLILLRSIHLWVIVGTVALSARWFRGPGRAAAAATYGLIILFAFVANQWPMVRPDSFVSLFALAMIVCAGLGLTRGGARFWFGAGLAASCGAFTHLIASSLVASSAVLFVVHAVQRWREADDVQKPRRDLLASFAAYACGGALGAVMFYASFGFRFGDQLQLFTAYRELVASTDSYATAIQRHLFVAFRYLSPNWAVYVGAVLVAGWCAVAIAALRNVSRETRTLMYGHVLPPVTVWTGYILSNGWYTNQHKGYAILHEVMFAWTAAAIVWALATTMAARPARIARMAPLLLGVLVAAQGVRQIDWHLAAAPLRAESVRRWVSIDDYAAHVLRHIPARSTAWGSVMYGIETPERLQLIQVSEGIKLTPRIDERRRAELAPDYLLWGYPERRDSTMAVLRGDDSLLGKVEMLTGGARYRVASLVAAGPYGVTRIYARVEVADRTPSPLPDVSVFDPDSQQWLSRISAPVSVAFTSVPPARFAIGYEAAPGPVDAARTVTAVLPAGHYLLRVAIKAGSGDTRRRLIVAAPPEQRRQRIGELGPDGDFASYFSYDRAVVMLATHTGGALEISQFDDGGGSAIEGVEARPIEPLIDRAEAAGIHALPEPVSWTAAAGVRAAAIGEGAVDVAGDATKDGYQLVSPKIAAESGDRDRVTLHVDMTVAQGKACLGVLNGTKSAWLVSPDRPRADLVFVKDDTRGFFVVSANCNDEAAGNTATRFTVAGGRYSIEPSALYTDRFMNALDAVVAGPADADVSGGVPGLMTVPPTLQVTRAMLDASPQAVTTADLAFQAPIVRVNGADWTLAGRADAPYSYLLQSKPRRFDARSRLIVSGALEKGGVTLGLQERNQWAVQVNITESGPFTVVIAAPASGDYSIVAANLLKGSLDTSIAFTKFGVLRVP